MTRKTITAVFTILFALTAGTAVQAKTLLGDYLKEKDIKVEISAGLDFYDKYVWRGFLLDNDNVLQPSVTISGYGFEGGFWGSWDAESHDGLASDEVDGWLGYSFDLGFISEDLAKVGMSFGHTWYDFPEASTYSREFYLGFTLDTFLSPYFTWYYDYADEENGGADGQYYMFGIGHSLSLNEDYGITLDLGQEVGVNDAAFIKGEGGYTLTTAGVTVPLTGTLTMTPKIGYSVPFGDLKRADDGNQAEQFFGGVSLAYSF